MKITFFGAAGQVTGSCTLVENDKAKVLIDCGAFQGSRQNLEQNSEPLGFDPKTLTAVLVTHAHYDHCGRLPRLVAQGYRGPIFCTAGTADLVKIVLEDSLKVMESDYQRLGIRPHFTESQLEQTIKLFKTIEYGQWHELAQDASALFINAGHILGSASIIVSLNGRHVVFSGDIGNDGTPIIRRTQYPKEAEVVVMESTYGNRSHGLPSERLVQLEAHINETANEGGVLLIPAFSIERTQEILYELHQLADQGRLPKIDFYLDSPLAIRANEIFREHHEYYDEETSRHISQAHDFLSFPRLKVTMSVDESKIINGAPFPKVIIAGSGMMEGGRIMHHLKKYLPMRKTTVLVVGYQAIHTLGRKILNGDSEVEIFGARVPVRAKVVRLDAYSAHADNQKLVAWANTIKPEPKFVFLNHGEQESAEFLSQDLQKNLKAQIIVPEFGKSYPI